MLELLFLDLFILHIIGWLSSRQNEDLTPSYTSALVFLLLCHPQ